MGSGASVAKASGGTSPDVSKDTYRAALKNTSLKHTDSRNLKAIALGRKSAGQVLVSKNGFSVQFVHICEGQVVTFRWDEEEGSGLSIIQTVHDGNSFRPVVGGFRSGKISRKGVFECQFNQCGEYSFACGGLKCRPLTVIVDPRRDIEVEVTDEGFRPKIVRIDEGNAIHWIWSDCERTHSVTEATFSHSTGMLHEVKANNGTVVLPTKAGSFRKEFNKPGLFYFQTESPERGQQFCCLIHVRERQREYKIQVKDTRFSPQILLIEEGDRIWWEWKQDQCEKPHCVYEIELPRLGSAANEAFKYKNGGFRWTQPSMNGLLSHEFFEPGIFYYSDQCLKEAAGYFGTIIVKPKVVERFIELTPEGFQEEVVHFGTGERLWWTWMHDEFDEDFKITEVCKCLAGVQDGGSNRQTSDGYMDEQIERIKVVAGLELAQPPAVGVYHYQQVAVGASHDSTCSVIANHHTKNHTVYVTDKGISPKIVNANPGDRVWWIWDEGQKPQNVVQVSHSGQVIDDGFVSGAPVQAPSAFMHQFTKPGCYYYRSDADKYTFGVVIVTTPHQVHEVQIGSHGEISPEVKAVRLNDAVAWTFDVPKQNDVHQLIGASTDDENANDRQQMSGAVVPKRRCMHRAFNERGVFHYVSNSFSPQATADDDALNAQPSNDLKQRISTIIVDDVPDNIPIGVDVSGFEPLNATIKKGDSIIWTWKNSGDELHNIVRIDPTNDNTPVEGEESINSGEPVPRSSFIHAFDDIGTYAIASEGAPGVVGRVSVVDADKKTSLPYVETGCNGGLVEESHVTFLACDTPNAQIFYTTDGSAPQLHRPDTKIYDKNQGVHLSPDAVAICIIRAVAVAPGMIASDVFTSGRFMVTDNRDKEDLKRWNYYVPRLRSVQTKSQNEIEVTWDSPPENVSGILDSYQLFLNGVSYGPHMSPSTTGASIAGLAGGRTYDIMLKAYTANDKFAPNHSNVLSMTCAPVSQSGGPLISLETTAKPDSMAVVWRPIPGAASYQMYLNEEKCGPQVVPDSSSERCKLAIESCKLHSEYKVLIAAISAGSEPDKLSNELAVQLPLKVKDIVLPDEAMAARASSSGLQGEAGDPDEPLIENDENDIYKEYLEIEPINNTDSSSFHEIANPSEPHEEQQQIESVSSHGQFQQLPCPEIVFDLVTSSQNADDDEIQHLPGDDVPKPVANMTAEEERKSAEDQRTVRSTSDRDYPQTPQQEVDEEPRVEQVQSTTIGFTEQPVSNDQGQMPVQEIVIAQNMAQTEETQLQMQLHEQLRIQREELQRQFLQQQETLQRQLIMLQEQLLERHSHHEMQQRRKEFQQQKQRLQLLERQHQTSDTELEQELEIYIDESGSNAECWSTEGEISVRNAIVENEVPINSAKFELTEGFSDSSVVAPVVQDTRQRLISPPHRTDDCVVVTNEDFVFDASSHFKSVETACKNDWKKKLLAKTAVASMFGGLRTSDMKTSGLDSLVVAQVNGSLAIPGTVNSVGQDTVVGSARQPVLIEESGAVTAVSSCQVVTGAQSLIQLSQPQVSATQTNQVESSPAVGKPKANHVVVIEMKDEPEQGSGLPLPVVTVKATDAKDVFLISWSFPYKPKLMPSSHIVSIVGEKFSDDVNSSMSFNCMDDVDGQAMPATRHCWSAKLDNCRVRGLEPGVSYSAQVESTFLKYIGPKPIEVRVKSEPVRFTLESLGLAGQRDSQSANCHPVHLFVDDRTNCQVGFGWDLDPEFDDKVTGFQLMVDGVPVGKVLSKTARRHVSIDKLQPGQTMSVYVAALSNNNNTPIAVSKTVKVACPMKPPAPIITEEPSFRKSSVIVAWYKPKDASGTKVAADEITCYRVFLDGKWYDDVKANPTADQTGYQYCLSKLTAGQSYDVSVQAISGPLNDDNGTDGDKISLETNADGLLGTIYCSCESDMSPALSITCPAPTSSPHMRIEDMNVDGVDVTWEMPQQSGGEDIVGYRMLRNGKPYGDVIPPDVHNMKVKDLKLGEKTELQLMVLTNRRTKNKLGSLKRKDSFSGCLAGPKLVVHYTGLVVAPRNVSCEEVTGHSAVVKWETEKKLRDHFVSPESYQVTWWPGAEPVSDINSQATGDNRLLITGLRPCAAYTVVVEARRHSKYIEMNEDAWQQDDGFHNTFIMTSKSEQLTLATASPPQPPSNLRVGITTCNSVQVSWDPPKERGLDVIGVRIDAVPINKPDSGAVIVELPANATWAAIDGLSEKTEYSVSVTAVTSEYFDQLPDGDESKKRRVLPRDQAAPRNNWLPSSTIDVMTSGTEPPTNVRVVKELPDSIRLAWTPARTYGSNRLQGCVVRWAENRSASDSTADGDEMARYRSLQADCNSISIDGLDPGLTYRFIVEAVVSVRITAEVPPSADDAETESSANRRTTHVLSKPVVGRTRAPCEPPRPIVTGYTTNTIQLYWDRPLLEIMTGPRLNESDPRHVKLSLEGYRLEINGRPHMRLSPGTQQCTLVKCRPGKTYNIALVALTCPEEIKKARSKKKKQTSAAEETDPELVKCEAWCSMPEDEENDQSQSVPITVSLPAVDAGAIADNSALYVWPSGAGKNNNGHVQVRWSLQEDETDAEASVRPAVRQYNVSWTNGVDGTTRELFLEPHITKCSIPASQRGVVYDVTVKPQYDTPPRGGAQPVQRVQCLVPGPSEPPNIWTRFRRTETLSGEDEAIVEWSEPRLRGVKISGYQIYVNGKKTSGPLNSKHRRAIIQLKGKRVYRVTVKALSSDSRITDSEMSNTLTLSEPLADEGSYGLLGDLRGLELLRGQGGPMAALLGDDWDAEEGFAVSVVRLTDASIHLDWSQYQPPSSLVYYRVVWSSATNPVVREVRLPGRERSCVLHKCYPGTYHNVRVYAVGSDDLLLARSRRLTVQTSAAPEPPSVSVRTVNFNFITIEWLKPTSYGDAPVTGYKVYVNGIVDSQLSADGLSYTLTGGSPCKDYVFQVQALSSVEKYVSRLSDPVVITWPGITAPILQSAPLSSGAVRLSWDPPYVTKGITVKHYVVVVLDAVSKQKFQTLIFKENARYADILDLRSGTSYMAALQVHVNESAEVVESEWIEFEPVVCADPPHITVTVIGLDERRQLEHDVCCAINKRDRLLSFAAKDPHSVADLLSQTEGLIDENLSILARQYTGFILAHVSWSCRQSNASIDITGFQVMVNGKKYGSVLNADVYSLRIKIGIGQPSHQISILALYEVPSSNGASTVKQLSVESNAVELTTESFVPFAFYSFLSQLARNGGANVATHQSYAETLAAERRRLETINGTRLAVNEGLLATGSTVPQCAVMDALTGEYRPLTSRSGAHSGVRPTAIFFWSPRSSCSQKYLGWFVKFAKSHVSQYECMAIACGQPRATGITDRQEMVSLIVDHGWRDDACVQHLTSHVLAKTDSSNHLHGGDLCSLLGVLGVPSVIIMHPKGNIAWRGRYCAFEYRSFEHFLQYVLAQVTGRPVPSPDPWDPDLSSQIRETIRRRALNRETSLPTYGGSTKSQSSAKSVGSKQQKLFVKSSKTKREPLTINARPFSASLSPYEEGLAYTSPPIQRRKSGHKSKSIY